MEASDAKRPRPRGGEPEAEEASGRGAPGHGGAEGYRLGKVLRPAVRRRAWITYSGSTVSASAGPAGSGMDVSSCRYRSRRADDGPLRERLRTLATLRRRFGYRRLGWLLDREGTKVNLKKVYRLYREEGLAVKRRRGRRRAIGTRAPLVVPRELNQRWSLDFVSDQLGNGRRFRLLNDRRLQQRVPGGDPGLLAVRSEGDPRAGRASWRFAASR